ncbi:MAG: hypothetical protein PHN31_00315 [Candidatus Gracilibacteria bacterium]|nr:hypothetical protein [Candidatus Gracilibacteria bacterium]
MIKINNTDSIVDIIQKIQEEESKEVILDFPFGHPILHNYLSLKILKNKAGNKPITIVTKDLTSRKIGKKLGINFSIIKDSNFIELSQNAKIINHNLSYWEYFKFEINRYSKLLISYLTKNKKIDEFKKYSLKYYNKNGAGVFILILLLSIFIFFVVLFFAINKTYIYIKPEINIKTIAYNYIFKDLGNSDETSSNGKIIKVKKISKTLSLEEIFQTSGIYAGNSKKTSGEVTFYNTYTENVSLKINTRIENKDGLIFETKTAVTIPAGSIDTNGKIIPGIIKSEVAAKDYDINGRYIGTRGNKIIIKEKFSLPGLKGDDKTKIYAMASGKFSGGSDTYENILGENDIENSKNIFEDKLKKQALSEIKSDLDKENKTNNVTYEILSYDDIFKNAKVNITIPDNIKVGEKIKNFQLKGTIDFFCYIYNKDSVINKLESIVNERIIKEEKNINGEAVSEEVEKLLSIDKNSLRITNIIYEQTKPLEVKLTIEIDARMYKNFLNKNSAYVQRLKNGIYGLKKEDAEKILLNDKNIRNVDIDIQPFFMDKISNIENNVIFEIENTN